MTLPGLDGVCMTLPGLDGLCMTLPGFDGLCMMVHCVDENHGLPLHIVLHFYIGLPSYLLSIVHC